MANESTFAALPVRQRGTLEIIDTAMKLYRRYFGVLMGWSALVAVLFLLTFAFSFGTAPFLVYPLIPASGCCAVAAAVRGQPIAFNQVWDFAKPRFGALLLITFLSSLLMSVAFGVVFLVAMLIAVGGAWMFSAINAPTEFTAIAALIGTIAALIVGSVLSVLAYAWLGLVPIIACLEDDKRSAAALGRAWDLMKGSWLRVLGLATLLSIAITAVMGIVGGTIAFVGDGMGAFVDNASDSLLLGLGLTFSGFFGLFFLFWNPIQTLVLAVLYLDLRVRKEALDLEWSSYTSAPHLETQTPDLAAVELAAAPTDIPPAPELSPASMSGFAPTVAPESQAIRPPHPAPTSPTAATSPTPRPPAPIQSTMEKPSPVAAVAPTPTEFAPNPIQIEANPIQIEANPIQIEANPIQIEANPIQIEANRIQIEANPIQIDPNLTGVAPATTPATVAQNSSELPKETSSFSAAPSNLVSPPAHDAFDFSSSFSAGEAAPFSADDGDEKRDTKASD